VALALNLQNFNPKNRDYTNPSLFWVDKVIGTKKAYQLEQPADDDDVIKP
jgi:hypothetical protein